MWVARHAAKRVERRQTTAPDETSGGDSVDSTCSWVDEDEMEVLQTCSVDDILTPNQDENEDKDSQGEKMSSVSDEPCIPEKLVRGTKKQRINADYIH